MFNLLGGLFVLTSLWSENTISISGFSQVQSKGRKSKLQEASSKSYVLLTSVALDSYSFWISREFVNLDQANQSNSTLIISCQYCSKIASLLKSLKACSRWQLIKCHRSYNFLFTELRVCTFWWTLISSLLQPKNSSRMWMKEESSLWCDADDREDFKSVLFIIFQAPKCTGYFMLLLPMSEWADIYCAVGEPAKLGRGLWGGIGQ